MDTKLTPMESWFLSMLGGAIGALAKFGFDWARKWFQGRPSEMEWALLDAMHYRQGHGTFITDGEHLMYSIPPRLFFPGSGFVFYDHGELERLISIGLVEMCLPKDNPGQATIVSSFRLTGKGWAKFEGRKPWAPPTTP